MHRAISGDLQNEEEMDRAMEEAGEERIYQVRNTVRNLKENAVYSITLSLSGNFSFFSQVIFV